MTTVKNVVGLDDIKDILIDLVQTIQEGDHSLKEFGSKGLIMAGKPGCGKTEIIRKLQTYLKKKKLDEHVEFHVIKAHDLSKSSVGDSSKAVIDYFGEFDKTKVHICFIDEIEGVIPSKAQTNTVLARERTNAMLDMMSGIDVTENIYIIGATNAPHEIGQDMFRDGRFGAVHFIRDPDYMERLELVKMYISIHRICEWCVNDEIETAVGTRGYNGADYNGIHVTLQTIQRRMRRKDNDFILTRAHVHRVVSEKKLAKQNTHFGNDKTKWLNNCDSEN